MNTSPPEPKHPEEPNPPPGTYNPTPRRPIYQTETTGNYWADVREAFKRLSPYDDMQRVGEIPCARNSLLSGIASGVGVGVIRGLSVHPLSASHWAVGTFMLVSVGTWTICQRKILEERQRVQTVVEQLPKRVLTKPDDSESTQ
jgi:cytochrome c oxidase assembly protein subunit 20